MSKSVLVSALAPAWSSPRTSCKKRIPADTALIAGGVGAGAGPICAPVLRSHAPVVGVTKRGVQHVVVAVGIAPHAPRGCHEEALSARDYSAMGAADTSGVHRKAGRHPACDAQTNTCRRVCVCPVCVRPVCVPEIVSDRGCPWKPHHGGQGGCPRKISQALQLSLSTWHARRSRATRGGQWKSTRCVSRHSVSSLALT